MSKIRTNPLSADFCSGTTPDYMCRRREKRDGLSRSRRSYSRIYAAKYATEIRISATVARTNTRAVFRHGLGALDGQGLRARLRGRSRESLLGRRDLFFGGQLGQLRQRLLVVCERGRADALFDLRYEVPSNPHRTLNRLAADPHLRRGVLGERQNDILSIWAIHRGFLDRVASVARLRMQLFVDLLPPREVLALLQGGEPSNARAAARRRRRGEGRSPRSIFGVCPPGISFPGRPILLSSFFSPLLLRLGLVGPAVTLIFSSPPLRRGGEK